MKVERGSGGTVPPWSNMRIQKKVKTFRRYIYHKDRLQKFNPHPPPRPTHNSESRYTTHYCTVQHHGPPTGYSIQKRTGTRTHAVDRAALAYLDLPQSKVCRQHAATQQHDAPLPVSFWRQVLIDVAGRTPLRPLSAYMNFRETPPRQRSTMRLMHANMKGRTPLGSAS